MDRLDMAVALIQEVQEARVKEIVYKKEYAKAEEIDRRSQGWDYTERSKVDQKYGRILSKSGRNENLKIARRILVGEYEN